MIEGRLHQILWARTALLAVYPRGFVKAPNAVAHAASGLSPALGQQPLDLAACTSQSVEVWAAGETGWSPEPREEVLWLSMGMAAGRARAMLRRDCTTSPELKIAGGDVPGGARPYGGEERGGRALFSTAGSSQPASQSAHGACGTEPGFTPQPAHAGRWCVAPRHHSRAELLLPPPPRMRSLVLQRYKQLLFFATRMAPLPAELHTKENKVQGCVSQVRVEGLTSRWPPPPVPPPHPPTNPPLPPLTSGEAAGVGGAGAPRGRPHLLAGGLRLAAHQSARPGGGVWWVWQHGGCLFGGHVVGGSGTGWAQIIRCPAPHGGHLVGVRWMGSQGQLVVGWRSEKGAEGWPAGSWTELRPMPPDVGLGGHPRSSGRRRSSNSALATPLFSCLRCRILSPPCRRCHHSWCCC